MAIVQIIILVSIFGGYDVIVTVEEFVENEITVVDETVAQKAGKLLAKTHTIAEQNNLHVKNEVLFNPFEHNDLFAFDAFMSLEPVLQGEDKALFEVIVDKYNAYMEVLAPIRERSKYATQEDINENNLYISLSGEMGIFDFNRAGDNILIFDAVMQAIFVARLMDYPENVEDNFEDRILKAFWSIDICWSEDGLLKAQESGDFPKVQWWLKTIWKRLHVLDKKVEV